MDNDTLWQWAYAAGWLLTAAAIWFLLANRKRLIGQIEERERAMLRLDEERKALELLRGQRYDKALQNVLDLNLGESDRKGPGGV